MKKFKAFWLLFCFAFLCILPSYAVHQTMTEIQNKSEIINLDFWEKFNDFELKYFIQTALEANYDLKIADINSEIYKQYINIQRAEGLPSLTAGLNPSYSKQLGKSNYDWGFMLPLQASFEADIFLKNKDKTSLYKKDYEISLIDKRAEMIFVASMTGSLYFNILKTLKNIDIQNKIVELRKETHELMKLSNKEGLTPIQDVISANIAYVEADTELTELKKQKDMLINNFAVLLGQNLEEATCFVFSDIEKINFSGSIPHSIDSYSIVQRPDYLKAEKLIEKKGIDIKVAKKEFLPSLTLTGTSLFNASNFGSLLTTKNALMFLSGSLAQDLFSGGRKIANLKIKKAEYQNALLNYEKTNLTALQELNNALIAVKQDEKKYKDVQMQNELKEKVYFAESSKFENGMTSKLELIQAKENLLAVKKQLYSNKADCFIDCIGLYKTLGGYIKL